jgi:serine/threonine protein kinase
MLHVALKADFSVAEHYITGHQVALKFINRKKINLTGNSARVKREIQYLKVLRHPHIIKLYVNLHIHHVTDFQVRSDHNAQ